MRTLAKRLLAGTSVAIALSAGGNALAQSSGVENNQSQVGEIFAGQTLNVIDPDGGVEAVSGATGNALSVNAEAGDISVRSSQISNGKVDAQTDVEVHGWSPQNVVASTAVGNAGDIVAHEGSAEAGVRQQVGYAGGIWAGASISTSPSTTVDTSVQAKALGNTQGFYAGHTAGYAIVQNNHAAVNSGVSADINHVDGEAYLAADTVGNNVSSYGGSTALESWQRKDGEDAQVGAYVEGAVQNGQTVHAAARATANSLSAVHEASHLRLQADQHNENGVQAITKLYVGEFGSVSATADGVGNSIHAGVYGEQVDLDTSQFNGGTIEATANFDGDDGYDAQVAATAIGNTVTGFACSDCDATLDARNHQVNDGGVKAVAKTWVGGGRTVHSSATAVGNNASYFVTRPGQ